jgi:polysaccharide export outer membrane protein
VNVYIGGQVSTPGKFTLPAGTRFHELITGVYIGERRITPIATNEASLVQSGAFTQETSTSRINTRELRNSTNAELNLGATSNYSRISQLFDLRLVQVHNPVFGDRTIDLSGYFNSGNTAFSPFIVDGDQITLVKVNANRYTVSLTGAVNNPFTGTYRGDDTPENLLKIVSGLSPDADSSEVLIYRDSQNGTVELLNLNFEDWLENGRIQPNDNIIIKQKEGSQLGSMEIRGEVTLAGSIPIKAGETTLGEVIDLVQGLRKDANPIAAYLLRESMDNRGVRSLTDINMMSLTRTSDQFLEGFDYMELEQALQPNRMAVNLSDPTVLDMTVQNGDILYVPKDENTITVLGQVNVPGFYAFDERMNTLDYLDASSGLTVAANPDRIFVIKAGSRAWYTPGETELQSGDIIFVDRIPFEDVSTGRIYDIQLQQLKNQRTQLIIGGVGALAGIITAFVAITR